MWLYSGFWTDFVTKSAFNSRCFPLRRDTRQVPRKHEAARISSNQVIAHTHAIRNSLINSKKTRFNNIPPEHTVHEPRTLEHTWRVANPLHEQGTHV